MQGTKVCNCISSGIFRKKVFAVSAAAKALNGTRQQHTKWAAA